MTHSNAGNVGRKPFSVGQQATLEVERTKKLLRQSRQPTSFYPLSTQSATHDDRLRLERRHRRRRRGALARGREPEGRIRAVEAGEAEVVLVLRAHPVVGVASLERPLALHG